MSALTIIGIALAGVAFVLRLLEWLGIRPQTVRQALAGGKTRAALIVIMLYDLFLVATMLFAPRPSDFLWLCTLVVFLWTAFTVLRVLVTRRSIQILCNVASSGAVLYLTAVSWRLSRDWRVPLALSVMTGIWLITLVVEAAHAVRGRES